jgi:hypothetical protein
MEGKRERNRGFEVGVRMMPRVECVQRGIFGEVGLELSLPDCGDMAGLISRAAGLAVARPWQQQCHA